jgi:hypothetical protein
MPRVPLFVLALTGLSLLTSRVAVAAEVLAPPSVEEARNAALAWAASQPDYSPDASEVLNTIWTFPTADPTANERFEAVMQTFYLVDANVRTLVDACAVLAPESATTDFDALHTSADNPFYASNVRAFFARYLAVMRQYDQALMVFDEIEFSQLVDPAGALFYKGVCEHALLDREAGLATLEQLLNHTQAVPLRYRSVAELMQHDLKELEEKSLGEVARQMKDVERRLDLGEAGQRVQRQEERIIATLDEIIEKIEQQQGGGGGGGGGSQGGNQSGNPADDSYIGGVQGPGEVDPKSIGHEAGWGNLPEKEQAQVKNMLDKQFPSHYRQAVTEYLRKLARRPAPSRE